MAARNFLLFCALIVRTLATPQAVTVKGIVNCRGHRQPGTFVQLYEEDSVPLIDDDDLLGSVIADHRGVFCVKGYTDEISTIEPYILIEHNCGYEGLNEKHVFTRIVPAEYIAEDVKAKRVYHMGDIELLTKDAPVQEYTKRIYIETSIEERIRQCIPTYVQYKTFYERTITENNHQIGRDLPTDEPTVDVAVEPTIETATEPIIVEEPRVEVHEERRDTVAEEERLEEERRYVEEQKRRLEEEQQRLDSIRVLEEENLRLEEIRRMEEEKLRIEEIRRQEEEQQKLEMERREEEARIEAERRAEEERKREEEVRAHEQRRKEQEEEHKKRIEEYHRREKERQEALKTREEEIKRREEEEKARQVEAIAVPLGPKKDPCVHYPVITQSLSSIRSMEMRHEYIEDPCIRK